MSAIWVIATNTLRQTIRQRLYFNIVIFGVAMVLLAMVMANITFGESGRVVRSVGLSGATFAVDLMALLVAVALVHSEIDRKTLFVVLTRPVSRLQYLAGRYLGLIAALCIALFGFTVVFVFTLLAVKADLQVEDFVALAAIIPEAAIIAAFGVVLSTFSTPTLSAGIGLGFWVAAATVDDLVRLTAKAEAPIPEIAKAISYAMPAFARFNFRESAIYGFAVAPTDIVVSFAYGAVWVVVLLGVATAVLSRREMI